MRLIDITRELLGALSYPGDERPVLTQELSFEKEGYRLSSLRLCVHNGTHADAPSHFLAEGGDVASMNPALFVGPCVVRTVSGAVDGVTALELSLKGCEKLLLRGGALTEQGAKVLLRRGVRTVGTDRLSISHSEETEAAVHTALLEAGAAILENLRLDDAPDGQYFLFAPPLLIAGAEGAPVRAMLLCETEEP